MLFSEIDLEFLAHFVYYEITAPLPVGTFAMTNTNAQVKIVSAFKGPSHSIK